MATEERRAAAPAGGGRARGSARCGRCRMHVSLCLCSDILPVDTETQVVLLTHVTELDKPTNTGRLVSLGLQEGCCQIVAQGGPRPAPAPPLHNPARRTYLLYPDPGAPTLDAAFAHEDPRPLTLVVLDGTWPQTRRMLRRADPRLRRLNLPSGARSRFRLRKAQSDPDYLCTLEAVARALGIIEGQLVQDSLLVLLDKMVERTLFSRGLGPKPVPAAVLSSSGQIQRGS